MLELKKIWNWRECEARNSKTAEFYPWFLRYKNNLVQTCMSLPLRISCGLGFSQYTTNANESLNNRLKKKINCKESELPDFCSILWEMSDTQRKDTEKAIIRMGLYQIQAEYMEHVQHSTTWFKIFESSRKKHISEFLRAPLKPSKFSFYRVYVGEQAGTSGTNVDPTGGTLWAFAKPQSERLSVALEDTHFDPTIHNPIWKKVEYLVDSDMVNSAPGVINGFMVAIMSGKDPHFNRKWKRN